jgi:hypothetical protein
MPASLSIGEAMDDISIGCRGIVIALEFIECGRLSDESGRDLLTNRGIGCRAETALGFIVRGHSRFVPSELPHEVALPDERGCDVLGNGIARR